MVDSPHSTMPEPQESPVAAPGTRAARLDACLGATSIYYLTSLIVALGFSLGFYFVRPPSHAAPSQGSVLNALENYDARFYTEIARDGYFYDPTRGSTVAFFPAYPLAGRAVMKIIRVPPVVAMLIVSNCCFLASLSVLWLYARSRFGNISSEIADWVALSAAVIPTGCFFRLAYSESAFLLVAILAMYGIERRWPLWRVALLVGLATAIRPVGVALLAPLALYGWREPSSTTGRLLRITAYLLVGCWGLIAYMLYQYSNFGDPLAFAKTQRHWGYRHASSALEHIAALARLEPIWSVYDPASPGNWATRESGATPWFSLHFADPIYFLGGCALLAIGAWRRWLSRYEVSAGALLLMIPYATRAFEMQMSSMGRFLIVVFPVYLVTGNLLARMPFAIAGGSLCVCAFVLATYTALYAAGYPIF